jgi:hypothetical protein
MLKPFDNPTILSAGRGSIHEPVEIAADVVSNAWLRSCLRHPYLRNAARRTAFLDLVDFPGGTYRGWAKRWDWTVPRVQRFIATLAKQRILSSHRTAWGTLVEVRCADDTKPIQQRDTTPIHPVHTSDSPPIPLGSKAGKQLNLETRTTNSIARPEDSDNYTTVLIDTMNAILGQHFGDEYRPVMHDNRRSAQAIIRLKTSGVPLEFARKELEKHCRLFNPWKHGRGRLPGTLGYFEKGIIKAFMAREPSTVSLTRTARSDVTGNSLRGGMPKKLLSLIEVVVDRPAVPAE